MAVAALYYGLGGIAVMILLIMIYIAYASYFVFTTDNIVFRVVAYITVLLAAWFVGLIYATIPDFFKSLRLRGDLVECKRKVGEIYRITAECSTRVCKDVEEKVREAIACIEAVKENI